MLLIPYPGWGSGSGSTDLYQVHLELVAQSDCDNALDPYDEDVMICAGDVRNGGRDTCQVGLYHAFVNVQESLNKLSILSCLVNITPDRPQSILILWIWNTELYNCWYIAGWFRRSIRLPTPWAGELEALRRNLLGSRLCRCWKSRSLYPNRPLSRLDPEYSGQRRLIKLVQKNMWCVICKHCSSIRNRAFIVPHSRRE